jgi:hypothetical protein
MTWLYLVGCYLVVGLWFGWVISKLEPTAGPKGILLGTFLWLPALLYAGVALIEEKK